MGFFSGLTKSLLGGSESKSSSEGGFMQLPEEIQQTFKSLSTDISNYLRPGGLGSSFFTPMGVTEDENKAFSILRDGFTPTAESFGNDMSMLMNPFDNFVIDDINRQGSNEFSILKQAMNNAGQVNSNRSILGANDIDLSRMNQIGKFRQDQYNTNIDHVLKTLPALRAADAGSLLEIGDFMRNLDLETKQAPIQSILTAAKAMGVLPTDGGTVSKGSSSSSQGIGSTISGIAAAFSDVRLKENVKKVGEKKGFNIYEFNYDPLHPFVRYLNLPTKTFTGVLAQEVLKKRPDAVEEFGGFLKVNYAALGLQMEAA